MTQQETELVVIDESGKFNLDEILRGDLSRWSALTKARVYAGVDVLTKALAKRVDGLKADLRVLVLRDGEQTSEAVKTLEVGGAVLTVTSKKGSVTVNDVALKMLLEKKSIPLDTVFVAKPTLDTAKLELLIAGGGFTDDELASITIIADPPTPSLSVKEFQGVSVKSLLGK